MAAVVKGTALVTGGSRGIGAACCKRLAKDGFAIAVNYNSNAEAAEEVVAYIVSSGGMAQAFQGNVSSETGVEALFNSIDASSMPPLTALVNNAGVLGPLSNDLAGISPDAVSFVFNTNVLGPLLCCREAAKRMGQGAAIVNISSGASNIGQPLLYSMSKAALNSMQIGLIPELARKGIRINSVSPGFTTTDMITDMSQEVDIESSIPMGRTGHPEEIAATVSFLLSADASYVCGANVRVSGGRAPGSILA
eukprot:GGOE01036728.1.p1 GENE.GGOE01036728.1~~GGOE01036728.1.p1  ORF type:complete len:259 (-),score=63.81 GGOE01036728.1:241-993(-)